MRIARLDSAAADFDPRLQQLLHWSEAQDQGIEEAVTTILAEVRSQGDAAVLARTAQFDGVHAASVAELEIPRAQLQAAFDGLPGAQRNALELAAARVRSYHERQRDAVCRDWDYVDEDGSRLGQRVTPLDRVGIYVPGGKAAYPSSVLMNAIPA